VISLLKGLWQLVTFGHSKLGKQEQVESSYQNASVASRFIQLFEAHGVHRNQIPVFFKHNLTLADVQTEASLIEKLTPETLTDAEQLFFINPEWLAHGQGDIYLQHSFYNHPEEFGSYIDSLLQISTNKHFECVVFRSSKPKTNENDALLILKTPIGEIQQRPIYAYHFCPGWTTHYWKSCADLACCISQADQRKIYSHGSFVEHHWLQNVMSANALPVYDFEDSCIQYSSTGYWNPSEFSDSTKSFIEPLSINQDNFSIPSAVARWLYYYDKGDIYIISDEINQRVGNEFRALAKSYSVS
jgi:hypothetical protein